MMFKRCLILLLLVVSQLSAETAVMKQEPVKKTLSQRQKVALYSVVYLSNLGLGMIFPITIFSKNNRLATKGMLLAVLLGASVTLTTMEEIFFQIHPYLLGPCEESETKQENVPC